MERNSVFSNRHATDMLFWKDISKLGQFYVHLTHSFQEKRNILLTLLCYYPIMSGHFYYSVAEKEKKRFIADDLLDSEDFDFLQSFASDIDEIRINSSKNVDMCLGIINASLGNS
jgi:hypothetical protein